MAKKLNGFLNGVLKSIQKSKNGKLREKMNFVFNNENFNGNNQRTGYLTNILKLTFYNVKKIEKN